MNKVKTLYFSITLSIVFFLPLKLVAAFQDLPLLQVFTVEFAPFVSKSEKGEIKGVYVDKTRQFLKSRNLDFNILHTAWKAAYSRVVERSNSLIFPLARTPERENKFHWFHQLGNNNYYLYSKKGNNLEQLTKSQILAGDYKVACTELAVQCDFAKEFGFPDDRIIKSSRMPTFRIVSLVANDRIEFSIFTPKVLKETAKLENFSEDLFVKSFKIGQTLTYLAGSKNMDPNLLERLVKALPTLDVKPQ